MRAEPVGDDVRVAADEADERVWLAGWPISLSLTLAPLRRGRADPTLRFEPTGVWWATATPQGAATLHLRVERRMGDSPPAENGRAENGPAEHRPAEHALAEDGAAEHGSAEHADDGRSRAARPTPPGSVVVARAWGPGRRWALDALPRTLGADDDVSAFDLAANPVVTAAFDRFAPRFRVPRTERVLESLVPAVLEQRVTGLEAKRAWRLLVTRFGEAAPGPTPVPLWVPPDGATWAGIPSWEWHRAGVDPGRARTIRTAAERQPALERLNALPAAEARSRLQSLPGLGVWTSAEVAMRAWGDADAVPFGDFHLAKDVVWALTGRRNGTDEELAEVLAPWAGQRLRAARLVLLAGGHQPARGPRSTITDHRSW